MAPNLWRPSRWASTCCALSAVAGRVRLVRAACALAAHEPGARLRSVRPFRRLQVEDRLDVDLAPMLGFVLSLLVFLVSSNLFGLKQLGMLVDRPTGYSCGGKGNAVPIGITSSGEIYFDNRIVDLRAVRARVEHKHREDPTLRVLIVTDQHAETGLLTEVVDQVRLGGIRDITLTTN
jgi:biopolymer transport protein ExbD